jgi:hypothetical protein
MSDNSGYVYVVSNPAMPDIVKIGMTGRDDFDKRLKELYTTSVPFPFSCEYACKVDDCAAVEKALQIAFEPDRINPQREFFKIRPEQAIAILKLLAKEDTTTEAKKEIEQNANPTEIKSGELYKKQRRPPLNFVEMGIPVDSVIDFEGSNLQAKATVIAERKVSYEGQDYSLTRLTMKLLGIDYAVQPTSYWYFKGKCLHEYYNETYTGDEE